MKRIFLILTCVSFFIVLIDQFSKMYIANAFYLGDFITLIPEFFNVTHVRNPGAAFGIFSDSHPVLRSILLLGTPPIAVLLSGQISIGGCCRFFGLSPCSAIHVASL